LYPENSGIFDDVKMNDYAVTQANMPDDLDAKLIWNVVKSIGKTSDIDLNKTGNALDFLYLDGTSIFKNIELLKAQEDNTLKFLIIMSNISEKVKPVNINNILEEKGLLERKEDGTVSWEQTLAYFFGHGQLQVNLCGREPKGVVSPGQEYYDVRAALIKDLIQLTDPMSGEAIIEKIWKKEELYAQQHKFFVDAPDLVISFSANYAPSPNSIQGGFDEGKVQINSSHIENVKSYRMLILGHGIKQGYRTVGNLVDIAPTIFFLLGAKVTENLFDGNVLGELFDKSFFNRISSYQHEDKLTDEEEALIARRLEALGYLD
jgi:hypothetical protein